MTLSPFLEQAAEVVGIAAGTALTTAVSVLLPKAVAWANAHLQDTRMKAIAKAGGDVAYAALTAATHGKNAGLIDMGAAKTAAIEEGLRQVQQLPTVLNTGIRTETVRAAVTAGLGAALKADPAVNPLGGSTATASAPAGQTATATAGG